MDNKNNLITLTWVSLALAVLALSFAGYSYFGANLATQTSNPGAGQAGGQGSGSKSTQTSFPTGRDEDPTGTCYINSVKRSADVGEDFAPFEASQPGAVDETLENITFFECLDQKDYCTELTSDTCYMTFSAY